MVLYSLRVKTGAEKELRAMPKKDLVRLLARLQSLTHQPRPHGCEKLAGEEKYRIRQGDWRALYSIDDDQKTVDVVKVAHRREAYR